MSKRLSRITTTTLILHGNKDGARMIWLTYMVDFAAKLEDKILANKSFFKRKLKGDVLYVKTKISTL